MQRIAQDLRFALRMLWRNPIFSVVVVLSLTIGIGLNAAIFNIINSILIKSLPVNNPNELVLINQSTSRGLIPTFSYPAYSYFKDHNEVFASILATDGVALVSGNIEGAPQAEFVKRELVSANYFSTLGVNAVL
ncbi:MAG: ABC transporter permease, partial [Acidobacteria bacterium]|nr:ABC transporter permease [Acidobacteriota bacterium]